MNNDDILDRIDVQSIKPTRKQSITINNFFTIITISIMSIVIIWYVNFILPNQVKNKQSNELKVIENNKLNELRKKRLEQIDLARKLNAKS